MMEMMVGQIDADGSREHQAPQHRASGLYFKSICHSGLYFKSICQGLGRLVVKAQHRVCEIFSARVYAQGHLLAKDEDGICEHMTLQEVDLQTQASMLMCLVSFCGLCGPLYGPQRTFIPVNSTCHASDL